MSHLVSLAVVGLRRSRRLDPDEEWDEALGPTPGSDLAADIVGEALSCDDLLDLDLADLLCQLGQDLADHLLRVLHADVAGGQLHAVGVHGPPLADEADALLVAGAGDHYERSGVAALLVESPRKLLPLVGVLNEPPGLPAARQLVLGGRLRPALGRNPGNQDRAEVRDLSALEAILRPSGHVVFALLSHAKHLPFRL